MLGIPGVERRAGFDQRNQFIELLDGVGAEVGDTYRVNKFLALVAGNGIEWLGEVLPTMRFEGLRALWGN
jgi:hypothetical protein